MASVQDSETEVGTVQNSTNTIFRC